MPEEKEMLEAKKKAKKEPEALGDSKKIDLYINNSQEEEQGISIMNILSNMKRRFHYYVFVLIVGVLIGFFVPSLMYNLKDRKETAIALVGLDYKGAEEGKAPDGADLDISYLKSSYIIQNALNNVTLSTPVSVAQVQSNLKITGVLTDETKQQQEIIDKLLAERNSEYGRLITQFTLKYRAQYMVSVGNIFYSGSSKTVLSNSDLSRLLNSITASYADYFVETYQDKNLPENRIAAVDVDKLDYLDILDQINSSLDYLEDYCETREEFIPDFRSTDGLSFEDLIETIDDTRREAVENSYAYVYLYNVSKNRDVQLTNYRYQKREAQLKLDEVTESIATVQTAINDYKPDTVVISRPDGNPPIEAQVTSDYYNELVLRLADLNEEKSALQERITVLTNRISKLEGTPATDEQVAEADRRVNNAVVKAQAIYELIYNNSNELLNSNAYKNRYMHSITTFESENVSGYAKLAFIGAGIGLAAGLLIWAADGLIIEIRNVNRKNKEAK